MRILLIDSSIQFPSNPLFAEALEASATAHGHEWRFLDEAPFFRPLQNSLRHRVARKVTGRPLTFTSFNRKVAETAAAFRPDLALVVKGAYLASHTLEGLREEGVVLANYATDDPFSGASTSTAHLRACIPLYDLYFSTKRAVIGDVRRAGGQVVYFLPFAYKPTVHFPERADSEDEVKRFSSDVVFIGGADRDRTPYFEALIGAVPGLDLHLYGGYWQRSSVLRRYARGNVVGRDFRLAMGHAKIAVNLVRRMNRDGHVMRTFEAPACKAFMLAERTEEHNELLTEGSEMGCFGSISELIDKVCYYRSNESVRVAIAEAGHKRITEGGNTYLDRLDDILRKAAPLVDQRRDGRRLLC